MRKIDKLPFIDEFDIKYNLNIKEPQPSSKAVMFCLMDVSGSMTQATKDIAKRFFILLYLFLKRNYDHTEVVFIRHHTSAREVDEQEFFYSRETGGTIVSSALKLMQEIMAERYPSNEWNIYAAQASDGDNWNDDSPICRDILINQIMPFVQYYTYVEITPREHQALWYEYERSAEIAISGHFCDAANRLGRGYLSGLPRTVSKTHGISSDMTAKEQKRQPISTGSEWTFELIQAYERCEIGRLAARYALDTYPNQIEVISSEQMMDAYAASGMPVYYRHWSFGKHFLGIENNYSRGQMGLAYEIVINSDPCIAYLMEENTICMQALVVAHACYGHNSFFKGNYLFRTWTDASSIIDYLVFAKQYIMQCEERHGIDAVEDLLDSCHALMNYGVDRYKRPYPISAEEERRRQKDREEHLQKQINDLWRTIPKGADKYSDKDNARFPAEPQENLLYFIEKTRTTTGALAAGNRADRAQDCSILLPTASDPGDERRLGHVLALHADERFVCARQGDRRFHAGVFAIAY